jgi:exosome complex exonuclease DIS3/RRP44
MSAVISIQKRPLPTSDDASHQWTQRRFFKKTARGKVQKILRERYLRDDVSCGRQGCEACEGTRMELGRADKLEAGAELQEMGNKISRGDVGNHFIVLDTNVVLHQVSDQQCKVRKGTFELTIS